MPEQVTTSVPVPLARYALTIACCVVILTIVLAMLAHLLGQPSP